MLTNNETELLILAHQKYTCKSFTKLLQLKKYKKFYKIKKRNV